jgi:hypothetical protein
MKIFFYLSIFFLNSITYTTSPAQIIEKSILLNNRIHTKNYLCLQSNSTIVATNNFLSDSVYRGNNPYTIPKYISGVFTLGSYAITVAISRLYYNSPYTYLYIPIIGPFMALGNPDYVLGGTEGLVLFSGIAQTTFLTTYIIFVIKGHQWENKNKKIKVSMSLKYPGVQICMDF